MKLKPNLPICNRVEKFWSRIFVVEHLSVAAASVIVMSAAVDFPSHSNSDIFVDLKIVIEQPPVYATAD